MNTKTGIITAIIIIFTTGMILAGIFAPHLGSTVNAEYIRQSVANRQALGGGVNFGK